MLLKLVLERAAEIGDYSRIPAKYLDPATREKLKGTKKPRVKKSAEDKAQAKITKYQDFIERADYIGIPNRAKEDKTLLPLVLARAAEIGDYSNIPGPCLTVEAAIDRYERTGVATNLASDVQDPVYRYIIKKTGSLDSIPANKRTEELKQYCLQVNPDVNAAKPDEVRIQEKIERYREFIERADYNGIPNRAKGDKTLLPLVLARAAEIGDYSRIPAKYLDPATIEKLKGAKKSKATDGAKKKRTAKTAKTKKGSVSPKDIEIIEVSDDKINPDDVEIIEVSDDKINPDDVEIIDSGVEKTEEKTEINTDIVFANDVPENIKKLLFNSLSPFERKFICLI